MHNDPGQLHLLDLPAGCGGAGRVWLRRNANTACQTEKLPLLFAAHCLMSRIACLMRTLNSDTVSSSSFCIASMGMQTNMPAERQPRSPAQQHREALRSTATAIRTRKHRQAPGASIKSSECSFEARKPTAQPLGAVPAARCPLLDGGRRRLHSYDSLSLPGANTRAPRSLRRCGPHSVPQGDQSWNQPWPWTVAKCRSAATNSWATGLAK